MVSKRFRQQVKSIFVKDIWKKLFPIRQRQNQIYPTANDIELEGD